MHIRLQVASNDELSEGIWNYLCSAILTTFVLLKALAIPLCALFGVGHTPVVSR